MRSLSFLLMFLVGTEWSAPTSPLYVVVGPLNLNSLQRQQPLYDDYDLKIGGGMSGVSMTVNKGGKVETGGDVTGSEIDNEGTANFGGSVKDSSMLTGESGKTSIEENVEGSRFENRGVQSVGENVIGSELVNTATGDLNIGGNMVGSAAELGGDAAVVGNV